MTQHYKVIFKRSETYEVAITAESEEQARDMAEVEFNKALEDGVYHYLQTGDMQTDISQVFDVTDTDDAPQEEEPETPLLLAPVVYATGCKSCGGSQLFAGGAYCGAHAINH